MADTVTARPVSRTGGDSTQQGCTTWLLLSCIVLTLTTAFVFGWGLGAPNMYNQYTEPFLKGNDPCLVDTAAKSQVANNVEPSEAAPPQPVINEEVTVPTENVIEDVNEDYIRAEVDAEGNDVYDTEKEGNYEQCTLYIILPFISFFFFIHNSFSNPSRYVSTIINS